MFPPHDAIIYRNEAGEPIGWDRPSYDPPEPDDDYDPFYDPSEDEEDPDEWQ